MGLWGISSSSNHKGMLYNSSSSCASSSCLILMPHASQFALLHSKPAWCNHYSIHEPSHQRCQPVSIIPTPTLPALSNHLAKPLLIQIDIVPNCDTEEAVPSALRRTTSFTLQPPWTPRIYAGRTQQLALRCAYCHSVCSASRQTLANVTACGGVRECATLCYQL